jgi:hypothetical protein
MSYSENIMKLETNPNDLAQDNRVRFTCAHAAQDIVDIGKQTACSFTVDARNTKLDPHIVHALEQRKWQTKMTVPPGNLF